MTNEHYLKVLKRFKHQGALPYIALSGKWLEEAGFGIDMPIKVNVDYGKVTITHQDKLDAPEQKTSNLEGIVQETLPLFPKEHSFYDRDYRGYRVWLRLERESNCEPVKLQCPDDVYRFLKPLENESREVMLSLMLDAKNKVNGVYEVSKGGLESTLVSPSEILKSALLANSNSIILAHNHPSGSCEPSKEDINTTKDIVLASKLMRINILDHIIIGYNNYSSLKDLGHL